MRNISAGILAGALALIGPAAAPAQEAAAMPQLQVTLMTGKLQIETPGLKESIPGQALPYIRAGSTVRVLSGVAAFESDRHATIRARSGDAFRFTARSEQDARPGVLRVAAVTAPLGPMEISVGDERFDLFQKGAIALSVSGPGELTARIEDGSVRWLSLRGGEEDAARKAPRMLRPGEIVTVSVPERVGFLGAAVNAPDYKVSRAGDFAFSVERRPRPDVAAREREVRAGEIIAQWPDFSRKAAEQTMEKYGPPSEIDWDILAWDRRGAWKRIAVRRVPLARGGVLQLVLAYDVPPGQAAALASLDIGLAADLQERELSAASASEKTNFLALNLAHEVVTGAKTVPEAAEFYKKTVSLSSAGKSSLYMEQLLFHVPMKEAAPR
jgi:hypothetical protein